MANKAAIVVFSDPKSGDEEALGRLFNALASTYEYQQEGDEVTLLFQGTGTRWLGEVIKPEHPAHDLFQAVKDNVAGASCGCADIFGAADDVAKSGFDLLKDTALPGTRGVSSLRNLANAGYQILTF